MTNAASARWRYRAADSAGREARGEIAAATEADAVSALQARALWVIELVPETGGPSSPSSSPRAADRGASAGLARRIAETWARWSGQELEGLAVLTRTLATLLTAGVPLEAALTHATNDAGADPVARQWQTMLNGWRERLQRGDALATAAAQTPALPPGFAPALAAAEASGTLAATFERLASHLERQARTLTAIRTALVYPVILASASVIGTLVILLVVVPRFAALLSDAGATLPWSTRLLLGSGAALQRGGWWLLAGLVLVGVWLSRQWQSAEGRRALDASRLQWPVVGAFLRDREASRYLETLAVALGSGVPLLAAMALARGAVSNRAFAERLAPAEDAVRDGAPLTQPLREVLPSLPLRLLEAGEAAGALPAMAARAADAADAAAQRRLTRLVALIEPVLILGFGGLVGFVALALLQAIYGLNAGLL